jgi:sulfate permease, SulP family
VSERFVPVTLRGYRASWLRADVIAGVTLVAIAVPEQIATAHLAGMPAVAGLYAFVAGSLAFAVLGRDRQMSVGADSTIAPIIFAAVAGLAAVGSARYVDTAAFLAVMVGAIVMAAGLLRLGWIAEFLSEPAITGVLAGIAVQIVVHQLPAVLGLAGGGSSTISRLRAVADQLSGVNWWSVGIAVSVLALVVAAERVDRRIPGALVALVLSTLAVAGFDLTSHGVAVLGTLHGGLPAVGVPSGSWADVQQLALPALTIAFVCLAQTAATVRAGQAARWSPADFDQDLIAVGAGSVAAGLAGAFAVNASPPRTEVVRASGGRSQLAGIVAAAAALGFVLVATGLLRYTPEATLGAILLFIASRLFRVRDFRTVLRFDRLEFGLAVITLAAVAILGIEEGAIVAIVLSLADRTRREARPGDVVLGREVGTPYWIPPDIGHVTEQVPGVLVYLVYAPIWYGNADHVVERIRGLIESAAEPVRVLVLDADGISDIDYTGARKLVGLAADLRRNGVTTGIARSSHLIHHDLVHSGMLSEIGSDHLFTSVQAAVEALTGEAGDRPRA